MKGIDATIVVIPATNHYATMDKYQVIRRTCNGCGGELALYPFPPDEEVHTLMDCLKTIQQRLDANLEALRSTLRP